MEREKEGIEITEEKPHTNISRIEDRMRRVFRIALMTSLLGHAAPFAIESLGHDERNLRGQTNLQSTASGTVSSQSPKNGLIQYGNMDVRKFEEEKKELTKFHKALEIRGDQRVNNRNPERAAKYMRELKQKLESGEYIPFLDFRFSAEETVEGIDHEFVENAKRIFFKEMETLKKERPAIPTPEFLNKVIHFTESGDSQPYEPTQSHVTVYLNRKGKNLRGNCDARATYRAMALEYLYPEYKDGIKFRDSQETAAEAHKTVVLTANGKSYLLDSDAHLLTDEEKNGTAMYSLRRAVEAFAGLNKTPVIVEKIAVKKEPEKKENEDTTYDATSLLGPPPTDNMHFPSPNTSGELENKHKPKANYYSGKYTPPEVRELEAEKKKLEMEQSAVEESKVGARPALDDTADFDVSDMQTVRDTAGRVVEVLPWKPIEYSHDQIGLMAGQSAGKIHSYYASELDASDRNFSVHRLRTPSKRTIERINGRGFDSAIYNEVEHYSQEALEEIMATGSKRVVFVLDTPHLPTSLQVAFARKGNFYNYPETIGLFINNEEENSLPPEEFDLLMPGKSVLEIHYVNPKAFNYEELVKIFQSGRRIVYLTGLQCPQNAKSIMEAKKKVGNPETALMLNLPLLVEIAFADPMLLTSEKIVSLNQYHWSCANSAGNFNECVSRAISKFFGDDPVPKTSTNGKVVQKILYNTYLLRFVIEAKYGKSEQLHKVKQKIDLLKQDFEKVGFNYAQIEEEARKEFAKNGISSKPKTIYESCPDK